jgi:endo-1,4-beta-xylanase
MRSPLCPVLKAAAGIILLLFLACGGSGSRRALDAGSTAGVSTGGTEEIQTGGRSLGGAGSTAIGGTPAGGAGGKAVTGGTLPDTTGGRAGGSTAGTGTGGTFSTGGTSVLGGSVRAGRTGSTTTASGGTGSGGATVTGGSSNPGGGAGGSSAIGGATAVGPSFPARFVGNIDTRGSILTDFSRYWDQFTPENAGNWTSVQGTSRSTFNWKALDAMYKYTEENSIIFKEMCFIWGAGPPSWLNNDNVMEAAKIWMKAFCDRYPKTRLIDVVNEPLHPMPNFTNGLGGGGRTTWDWVANSFKLAREACPNAVLILNDYNICEYATDHQGFLDLMKAIKQLDAPVDAIGCEGHDAAKVPVSKFKDFMDKLASETGLPVYITEFDIGLGDDELQRAQYADYFTMFWDDPNVKGVTIWGYITGATWRSNTGIMSSTGTMRPAMTWLMDFLKRP